MTNQIIEEGRIQYALRERKPRTDFVDIAFKGEEPQDDVESNDTTVDENFVKDVMDRIQDQLPQIWANATAYPVDNFRLDIFQLLPDVYTVDINIDTTDYQLSCNFSLHFDVDVVGFARSHVWQLQTGQANSLRHLTPTKPCHLSQVTLSLKSYDSINLTL